MGEGQDGSIERDHGTSLGRYFYKLSTNHSRGVLYSFSLYMHLDCYPYRYENKLSQLIGSKMMADGSQFDISKCT